MRPTAKSSKKTVYYNDRDMYLFIDGVRINSANGEHHRNLTESNFASIPNRDRFVEHLLMMASAMLVDYHYHRQMEDVYDWSACTGDSRRKPKGIKGYSTRSLRMLPYHSQESLPRRLDVPNWLYKFGYLLDERYLCLIERFQCISQFE